MRPLRATLLWILPAWAAAQGAGDYDRGLAALDAGDHAAAVASFYPLAEGSPEPELRARSTYHLARSLERMGLHTAAALYYSEIIKGGRTQPFYLKAVEGLVEAQRRLEDSYLIPTFLAAQLDESWKELPPEVRQRIDYLVATTHHRGMRLEQARERLLRIPASSPLYAKARYLLGVVDADPRFPGGARNDEALAAFEEVLRLREGVVQEDLTQIRQLAQLGVGRVRYAKGEYRLASEAYERVPRFSRYWDQALFENAFARFRDEDHGGALGSLQALHAPQFEGAFQPESWLLKATVYHFSCLYEESQAALKAFDELYLPLAEQLRPLVEADVQDYAPYLQRVIERSGEGLPRPILLWVRANGRIAGLIAMLEKIDAEKEAIAGQLAWRGTLAAELTAYLDQNRQTVVQTAGKLVKNRLSEAYRIIRKLGNDGDLVRLETTLAQKKLIERGVDQGKLLGEQRLHRPAVPEAWDYWQFQGEFWIDEIGYYQITLKRGCPPSDVEPARGAAPPAP